MQPAIQDSFSGIVYFEKDEESYISYPFTIQEHTMTVLSVCEENPLLERIEVGDWLFGVDSNNYDVAFQCNNISTSFPFANRVKKYLYSISVIIKAPGNMNCFDLSNFDSLVFKGGAINAVYLPQRAYNYDDESDSIKLRSEDECKQSYDTILYNKAVKLSFSTALENARGGHLLINSLGTANSFIKIDFAEKQALSDLDPFLGLVNKVLSFCVGQKNIGVSVLIAYNDMHGSQHFASCKINEGYKDIVNKNFSSVIRFDNLCEKVVPLFQLFDKPDVEPYIGFLPTSNQEAAFIKNVDVCMLCTSLEREYKLVCKDKKSAKERIKSLYNKYYSYMKPICERHIGLEDEHEHLNKIYSTDEFCKKVDEFIDLRNCITHEGVFSWGERAEIYAHLYLVFCFAVFDRADINLDFASRVLESLFSSYFWE